jgi:hypothetical protein
MNYLTTLVLLALSVSPLNSAPLSVSLDLTGRDLTFAKSGVYDLVVLEGATMTNDVGAPSLPVLAVNVVLPQGMRLTEVYCEPRTTEGIAGTHNILPAQPPLPLSSETRPEFVPPDPAVYGSDRSYPGKLAEPAGQSSMSGYNVARLLVYPLQYQPKSGTLTFSTQVTLSLTLEPADLGYLPVGNRSPETRTAIEKDVRALVANPEDVTRFAQ